MEVDQIITLRVVSKVFVFTSPMLTSEQLKQTESILSDFYDDYPYLDDCFDDQFAHFDEAIAYEICVRFVDSVYQNLGIVFTILNTHQEFSMTD